MPDPTQQFGWERSNAMPYTYVPCPRCGEEICCDVQPDSDDSGRPLCTVELETQTCACDLTADEIGVVMDAAANETDWSDEP
jgi:hypothetical protein